MRTTPILLPLLFVFVASACKSADAHDPRSPSGAELTPLELSAERRQTLQSDLEAAELAHQDAIIWHGRRLAYLGRYGDAIDTYTQGLALFPFSHKLLRHRGHRHITVRQFDRAIADLSRAASLIRDLPDEVEPDGAPNEYGIPRSTHHSNVWYHLALAHWLTGDYERAAWAWGEGLEPSRVNDDMLVATSYWLFLARMRSGQEAAAERLLENIHGDMEILENHAYHKLLLCFAGKLDEAAILAELEQGDLNGATTRFGLGAWRELNGDEAGALEMWRRIVPDEDDPGWPGFWPAFGYIAAEVELARRSERRSR